MPEETKKQRKKMVVEEVASTETPAPHIEPGVHEKPISKTPEQTAPSPIPVTIPVAPPPPPQSGPNALLIIIPGIFLLGALLGGIIFYQSSVNKNSGASPALTPIASGQTAAPTATAEGKEIDLQKYSISVLNGSGIKGGASKAQDLLEKAGFKVSSTGNAANYDYTETVIQTKSGVEEGFISKLKETLNKNYKVAAKTQSLSASSKDSVVVIIGASKNTP